MISNSFVIKQCRKGPINGIFLDIQQRICYSKDSLMNASNTLVYLLTKIYKQNMNQKKIFLILKGMAHYILQPSLEQINVNAVTLLNPAGFIGCIPTLFDN